ncbi:MAG: hypothetical protein Tsb0019_39130 [Roseibium sp.]
MELRDGKIFWAEDGRQRSAELKDLRRVNLKVNFGGRGNVVGIAGLFFINGVKINVFSANAVGWYDHRRSQVYRSFVEALHEAIPREALGRIEFVTGGINNGAARFFTVLMLAMICGAVGVLIWNIGKMTALHIALLAIASAMLIWPLWRMLSSNTGQSYRPHRIPRDLLP